MTTRLWSVVFDANDPAALARFWADALELPLAGEREDEVWVTPPESPELNFVPAPEPKTTKNRIHPDLASESAEHQRATVDRLVGAGATRIDIGQPTDAKHVVLADPEGNEFCVVTPRQSKFFEHTGRIAAIAYDQASPTLGRFWSEASGWPVVYERGDYVGLGAPSGVGPLITFGPPVAPKTGKNRLHLDVAPPADGDQNEEVERLLALGARRIDIGQGEVPWVVLADPEGNEFCVLTPR